MHYPLNTDAEVELIVQAAGVRLDPTSLSIQIVTPSGSTLNYVYGTDAEVVREAVGLYKFKIALTAVGTYTYLWTVSGNVNGTTSGTIQVASPARNVTINAQNTVGASAVPDARIEVKSGSTLVGAGKTDALGAFVLPLKAGIYTISAFKQGWAFSTTTVTVLGTQAPAASESFTVLGSALTIGTATVATIRLYGYVVGAFAKVIISRHASTVHGGSAQNYSDVPIILDTRSILTNAGGYWEADALVGSRITVHIPSAQFKRTFIVPNKSPLNVSDVVAELTERSA